MQRQFLVREDRRGGAASDLTAATYSRRQSSRCLRRGGPIEVVISAWAGSPPKSLIVGSARLGAEAPLRPSRSRPPTATESSPLTVSCLTCTSACADISRNTVL